MQNVLMRSNLEIISDFFIKNQFNDLTIIGSIEKIKYFYIFLIEYFCQINSIKLVYNPDINTVNSLFKEEQISFFLDLTNSQIPAYEEHKEKKIILIEYKLYKKLQKKDLLINSLNFKTDVHEFISKFLKIKNNYLINNIINNPVITFSEINKYLINSKYNETIYNEDYKNNLINLRKEIYSFKRESNKNYVYLYNMIKKEVELKKFSFLTY